MKAYTGPGCAQHEAAAPLPSVGGQSLPGWRVDALSIKAAEVRRALGSVCPGVVGGTALWLAGQRGEQRGSAQPA